MRNLKQFFTSDWHINHAKSIEYDKRPFQDVEQMHSTLIRNYNSTVPDYGICYFLGDIGVGDKETTKKVITSLNGTKVLVLGNHDRGPVSMRDCGFDVVLNGAVIYIAGQRVTMSHCPLKGVYREPTDIFVREEMRKGNWHGEHKHHRFTFENEGQFHLHGHIHASEHTPHKDKILGRQFDVGVPGNNYRPVSISVIESWIIRTLKEEKNSEEK